MSLKRKGNYIPVHTILHCMHFYDDMYFLWLFLGLINDDNFHFSPSKLFPFGDEGILPFKFFF